jgi:NIPSNAP
MFVCDTGGIMNQVTHFYHYRNFEHRDQVRRILAQHQDWQSDYIDASRTTVSNQVSISYTTEAKSPLSSLSALTSLVLFSLRRRALVLLELNGPYLGHLQLHRLALFICSSTVFLSSS